MITILFVMAFLVLWCLPGLPVARALHSERVKEIRSKPVQVIPPQPPRPQITLNEMLHDSGRVGRMCAVLDKTRNTKTCNCSSRDQWVRLKNAWLDYNEWRANYGHITNGVATAPTAEARDVLWAVPLWPLALAMRFIRAGEARIPDYREIERMEQELARINATPLELQEKEAGIR